MGTFWQTWHLEHLKKKVVELLYKWTREIPQEPKIAEAYDMLKQQGIIWEDPVYVDEVCSLHPFPSRQVQGEIEEKAHLQANLAISFLIIIVLKLSD